MPHRTSLARTLVVYLVFLIPSLSLLAMTGFYFYGSIALGWLWLEGLMAALTVAHRALQVVFFRLARRTYHGLMSDGQFFGYAMATSLLLVFGDGLLFAFSAFFLVNGSSRAAHLGVFERLRQIRGARCRPSVRLSAGP